MPDPQSTIITALLEQLITTGPESMGQVFIRPRNPSRQSRPMSERVPALILRRVTRQRRSFSEPLVCNGISEARGARPHRRGRNRGRIQAVVATA